MLLAFWTLAATAVRATGAEADMESSETVPDATITFRGRTAAIGVGFTWGASTVEFQGNIYPVRVDGFMLGAVGTASVEAVGEVFGLAKIEDLNGDYTAGGHILNVGCTLMVGF